MWIISEKSKPIHIVTTSYFEEASSAIVFHNAILSVANHSTGFDSYCPLARNLIGSWSGRNFLIQTATAGGIRRLIYFRKRISGYHQSFALLTLL